MSAGFEVRGSSSVKLETFFMKFFGKENVLKVSGKDMQFYD